MAYVKFRESQVLLFTLQDQVSNPWGCEAKHKDTGSVIKYEKLEWLYLFITLQKYVTYTIIYSNTKAKTCNSKN